ncbi:hypothetical protein Bbelb_317510 [Branchiostoma belcheri]|nr:hypothetical protein Bbelb_317510 [Branchiostoma belcheri]
MGRDCARIEEASAGSNGHETEAKDWTDVERLSSDRNGWRKIVRERMDHLDKWEKQRGNKYEWSMEERALERNVRGEMDLVCRYEGCGKRCFTKEECTVPARRE